MVVLVGWVVKLTVGVEHWLKLGMVLAVVLRRVALMRGMVVVMMVVVTVGVRVPPPVPLSRWVPVVQVPVVSSVVELDVQRRGQRRLVQCRQQCQRPTPVSRSDCGQQAQPPSPPRTRSMFRTSLQNV